MPHSRQTGVANLLTEHILLAKLPYFKSFSNGMTVAFFNLVQNSAV
jgi:hypothetical protein